MELVSQVGCLDGEFSTALCTFPTIERRAEASYWTAPRCLVFRNRSETPVGYVMSGSLVESKHGCNLVILDGVVYSLCELVYLLVTPKHGRKVQLSIDWGW